LRTTTVIRHSALFLIGAIAPSLPSQADDGSSTPIKVSLPVGGQTLNDVDKVRLVLSGYGSFDLTSAYSGRVIGTPVSSAANAISLRITTPENHPVS
jgi:hypothetical protein